MKLRSQAGFTLVELMAAAMIMGLLVIGIFNLYIAIEIAQRKSYHLEIAARAGEREIESLRNSQYSSLVPGTSLDFTSELPAELLAPRSGTVDVSEPEIGLRRVDITISYKDGNGTKTIKQSSLIGILGIGQ
jgi:prepilin-type N-terminal cleavage/methylation domain-containing protein